jgi:DNA-binding protein HU-beta
MILNRKELAGVLGEKGHFPTSESAKSVDLFFETLLDALEGGQEIKISGFGVFKVRAKAARKGRNPKTGARVEIPARRVVSFKPSSALRKALNPGAV